MLLTSGYIASPTDDDKLKLKKTIEIECLIAPQNLKKFEVLTGTSQNWRRRLIATHESNGSVPFSWAVGFYVIVFDESPDSVSKTIYTLLKSDNFLKAVISNVGSYITGRSLPFTKLLLYSHVLKKKSCMSRTYSQDFLFSRLV